MKVAFLRLRPEWGSDKSAQGIALGDRNDIDPRSPERAKRGQSPCLNRERGT
jgi:hypothetical protein